MDDNRIAGAVALVLRDGKPVYEAFGWADKEANRKMTTDVIFRIASQSKAITSAAILALVEEGKVGINDPASRYIPGFARTMVAVTAETDLKPKARMVAVMMVQLLPGSLGQLTDRFTSTLYQSLLDVPTK